MDTAAPSQVPAPNNLTRVRPAFRLLAIVTFVIVVPLAAWNSWDAIEARRVSRAVDGIRAAGEPVTFSFRPEYAGPEPPNDAGPDYIAAAVLAAANPTVNDRTLSRPGDPPGWKSQSVASEFHDAVLAGVVPPTLQGATADALAMKEDALRLLDRATALSFKGFRPGTAYGYNGSDSSRCSAWRRCAPCTSPRRTTGCLGGRLRPSCASRPAAWTAARIRWAVDRLLAVTVDGALELGIEQHDAV